MSAKTLRSVLRSDLETRLSPVFVDEGFSAVPVPPDDTWLKRHFPLGSLQRKRGNELDVIDFQFDKHGRPRFTINFGTVPEAGIALPWGDHVDRDAVSSSLGGYGCRLSSSPHYARWFKLGMLSPKNETASGDLVDQAVLLSTEVNQWFETGTIGKHVRHTG